MEESASKDPRSYSLYFDLNIWSRAPKVTGTSEKRAPQGSFRSRRRSKNGKTAEKTAESNFAWIGNTITAVASIRIRQKKSLGETCPLRRGKLPW